MSATFRRPTVKQIATLRDIKHGPTPRRELVEKAVEKRWAQATEDDWYDLALTEAGDHLLTQGAAIERLSGLPFADRPDVRLQKRRYNRAWLGWEVLCYVGCAGGAYGTRRAVWATNDHEARDKWNAEAAFAKHVLWHIDQAGEAQS